MSSLLLLEQALLLYYLHMPSFTKSSLHLRITKTTCVFQNPYKIICVVQLFGLQAFLTFLYNMKHKEDVVL